VWSRPFQVSIRKNVFWHSYPSSSPLSSALWVKRLQQGLPNAIGQDHQQQHSEGGEGDPAGFHIALGLAQQLTPTRRRARHPEVEKGQAGQVHDGARDAEGEERHHGCQRVRQDMLGDHRPVADAHGPRRLDVSVSKVEVRKLPLQEGPNKVSH